MSGFLSVTRLMAASQYCGVRFGVSKTRNEISFFAPVPLLLPLLLPTEHALRPATAVTAARPSAHNFLIEPNLSSRWPASWHALHRTLGGPSSIHRTSYRLAGRHFANVTNVVHQVSVGSCFAHDCAVTSRRKGPLTVPAGGPTFCSTARAVEVEA